MFPSHAGVAKWLGTARVLCRLRRQRHAFADEIGTDAFWGPPGLRVQFRVQEHVLAGTLSVLLRLIFSSFKTPFQNLNCRRSLVVTRLHFSSFFFLSFSSSFFDTISFSRNSRTRSSTRSGFQRYRKSARTTRESPSLESNSTSSCQESHACFLTSQKLLIAPSSEPFSSFPYSLSRFLFPSFSLPFLQLSSERFICGGPLPSVGLLLASRDVQVHVGDWHRGRLWEGE